MLTLYTKASCPFCRRVVPVIERLGLEVEYKDIKEDEKFAEELIDRGGKRQVPYLIDEETGTEMYESDDIVAYLQKQYGSSEEGTKKPKVHISDSTCIACEG